MALQRQNNDPTTKLLNILLIALGVLALGYIIFGIASSAAISSGDAGRGWFWVRLIAAIFQFLVYVLIAVVVIVLAKVLLANTQANKRAVGSLERVEDILHSQSQDIRSMAGLACLSDQAKSLIYHENEISAMNEMVNAMLLKQDQASAESLLERMEKSMGMATEAAHLREEITATQQATLDEKIDAALNRINTILQRRDWAQAKREADRLIKIFPENPKIKSLPQTILNARNSVKRHLLKEYGEAVGINDVEKSIDMLKELDKYLSPQEAAALAESARDVFKKKLHNLGVQFAIAVTDTQWQRAVESGEEIMRDYPNSRMAREVNEKIDMLRDYAAGKISDQPQNPDSPLQM
ncbi:MAG: hypothetical protein KAR11_05630 [Phycisphaerae bacterium]|nr:hypothetical protein [Phycisphaerae bacterium]